MLRRSQETEVVLGLVRGPRVLDVGCGNGRYLRLLKAAGLEPTGVDVNQATVDRLRSEGFDAFTPDDMVGRRDELFDSVLMSHVLEHMTPAQLVETVDMYLDHLAPEGRLVVASPLMHPGFYDDYDHIKPYTPKAVADVFGGRTQFQHNPRHELELKRVWIRKAPRRWRRYPGAYSGSIRLMRWFLSGSARALFIFSGGRIGLTTGWVGVFELATNGRG